MCSLLIMLLIALIKLVAVGGINTSLFNVSIMIMLPYPLMLKEIMTFMMWNKLKNSLPSRVHLNLPVCLKILMMRLMNMRFMRYLNFALIITRKQMAIFLNISIGAFHKWKRLMPCRSLWKKKLLKLEAHYMKKRRVMNKRRKNGSTHAYLLMRVTLYPLHYLIVHDAYQRRMNVMFVCILLKYLLSVKPVKVLIPLFLSLIEIMCL